MNGFCIISVLYVLKEVHTHCGVANSRVVLDLMLAECSLHLLILLPQFINILLELINYLQLLCSLQRKLTLKLVPLLI